MYKQHMNNCQEKNLGNVIFFKKRQKTNYAKILFISKIYEFACRIFFQKVKFEKHGIKYKYIRGAR